MPPAKSQPSPEGRRARCRCRRARPPAESWLPAWKWAQSWRPTGRASPSGTAPRRVIHSLQLLFEPILDARRRQSHSSYRWVGCGWAWRTIPALHDWRKVRRRNGAFEKQIERFRVHKSIKARKRDTLFVRGSRLTERGAPAYSGALFSEARLLERIFHLTENQTTVRRELLGGLTTFMAMAYVVVVNPRILGEAGMPVEGVLFATCVSAALATLVMGLWANYPIALAPGMSLNAYFTYSIVLGRSVPWQTALGVVFLSGTLFLILTVTNIREHIVNDIPDCLKHGTAGGIGLFIAFVGLRNAKIIVANPATFVAFGKTSDPEVLLAALGLIVIAILMSRKVGGAILIGIVAIALLGIPFGLTHVPSHVFSWPHPGGTFLKLDFRSAVKLGLLELMFVFFFVDLFDNVGTLVGVCEQGGFLVNGKFPRASRALLADAFGTMAGALTGTSTVTSYIESAAGVA